MMETERPERILARAARGEASASEIEQCIAETRADLDRNLSAVERRFSSEELIDQAMGYLRDGPTEFLSNFGQTVKANPLPTALLSISLGWLMLAGRRSPAYGGEMHAGDTSWSDKRRALGDAANSLGERAGALGESIGSRASSIGDTATSGARNVTGAAQRMTSGVRDRVSDLSDRAADMKSRVGGTVSDVGRRTHHAYENVRATMSRAGHTLSQQPKRLQQGYADMAEHHPFVLGLVAFAMGAAIAATVRRTQWEDETMGGLRDEAVGMAEQQARAELQRGMETAQTALHQVKEDLRQTEEQWTEEQETEAPFDERDSSRAAGRDAAEPPGTSQDRIH